MKIENISELVELVKFYKESVNTEEDAIAVYTLSLTVYTLFRKGKINMDKETFPRIRESDKDELTGKFSMIIDENEVIQVLLNEIKPITEILNTSRDINLQIKRLVTELKKIQKDNLPALGKFLIKEAGENLNNPPGLFTLCSVTIAHLIKTY